LVELRALIGFAGILATPSATIAQEALPCALLDKTEVRLFDGFEPAIVRAASAKPVKLRKGAVLGEETRPLRTEWMTIDAPPSGAAPAAIPMAFSPYLANGEKRFCTTMLRPEVFGADEGRNSYFVRCLVDTDGDGQYDHFHRYGELVATNFRTGKAAPSKGVVQTDVALPQPLRLVLRPEGAALPNAGFEPRVVRRLKVEAFGNDAMVVGLATDVSMVPQDFGIGGRKPTQTVTVPLREGAQGAIGGWTISVKQGSGGWIATAAVDPTVPPASLACNGAVVLAGEDVTLLTAGGSQTFRRTSIPSGTVER
jgi:hypothetical protein